MIETNNENKILKVLYNQVALVLAIGAFLWSIFNFVVSKPFQIEMKLQELRLNMENQLSLSKQLSNIKDNDLQEIKASMIEIKNNQIKIMNEVTELRTIVNLRK